MSKFTGKQIIEAGEKVGKCSRTIRRWIDGGCDILSESSLEEFKQSGQARSKGAAIKQTSLYDLSDSGAFENAVPWGLDGPKVNELNELPPPGEKGAVAALTRLQELEVAFAQRLQAALARNQIKLIQSARDDYTKIAESLRRYEKEIEESKRDLGHLIPRGDAIDGARASAMWLRLSFHSWLSSCLPSILALAHDDRAAKARCVESFTEIIRVSVKNAKEATLSLPDWAEAVILEEFHAN